MSDEKHDRGPVPGQILFGITNAARMLDLSEKSVRTAIARGEIHVRRFGTRVLIPREALERFARRDHAGVAGDTTQRHAKGG